MTNSKYLQFFFPCLWCFLTTLISCSGNSSQNKELLQPLSTDTSAVHQFEVKYAKGFSLKYIGDTILVDVCDPDDSTKYRGTYALVSTQHGSSAQNDRYDAVVPIPISGAICMTTPQLSYFLKLDALNKVVGMPNANMLHNHQVLQALGTGQIGRIGIEGDFDIEKVISLSPQVILVSPFKRGGYDLLRNLGIPLLTFLAYKEPHPLGQSEWIKLVSHLTGKEQEAQQIFDTIETEYQTLTELTAHVQKRPTVITGELRSDNWYVLGGNNYFVRQVRDAGADYFLKNNEETGGINMDFETVYALGEKADYWRMMNLKVNEGYSYDWIKQSDSRYADFKAFKERKIFYCDLRNRPFYEEVPMAPQVVLADLIKIFHPDLLPNHQPVYYQLLKK